MAWHHVFDKVQVPVPAECMVCTLHTHWFHRDTKSVAMKSKRETRFVCGLFANAVSSAVCCCSDPVGHIHGPCSGRAEAAGVQRGDVSPDKLFTLPCGNVRPPLLSVNCQSSTFSNFNRSTECSTVEGLSLNDVWVLRYSDPRVSG